MFQIRTNLIFLLEILPLLINGSLTYNQQNEKLVSIAIYSKLRWRPHFSSHNITVINIHNNVDVFDYCDLNMYSPASIAPLLSLHNRTLTQGDGDVSVIGRKWFALIDCYNAVIKCLGRGIKLSTSEMIALKYDQIYSLYVQKLGKVNVK